MMRAILHTDSRLFPGKEVELSRNQTYFLTRVTGIKTDDRYCNDMKENEKEICL